MPSQLIIELEKPRSGPCQITYGAGLDRLLRSLLQMDEVTRILNDGSADDPDSRRLMVEIYNELRRLAASKLALEKPGQTIQATELVNEVWIRIENLLEPHWRNRRHFYGAAAEVMRRVLVERARRRNSNKRGNGLKPIPLDGIDVPVPTQDDTYLFINEVLDEFAAYSPAMAEIVKLKYYVGLNHREIAALQDIAEKTVQRHLTFSKAWLHDAIGRKRARDQAGGTEGPATGLP